MSKHKHMVRKNYKNMTFSFFLDRVTGQEVVTRLCGMEESPDFEYNEVRRGKNETFPLLAVISAILKKYLIVLLFLWEIV